MAAVNTLKNQFRRQLTMMEFDRLAAATGK
jgi:hypothetical protein